LQNRVDPFGKLVATARCVLMTGNRGVVDKALRRERRTDAGA